MSDMRFFFGWRHDAVVLATDHERIARRAVA
jgi:hypothetical protein